MSVHSAASGFSLGLVDVAIGGHPNPGKKPQAEYGTRNRKTVEDWFPVGGECQSTRQRADLRMRWRSKKMDRSSWPHLGSKPRISILSR